MGAIERRVSPGTQSLACALAAVIAGCSADDPSAANPPWNVVIAMVDTLRADHLGVYGYPRDTSPNIDRFAQGAAVFENTRAQAPCTFPSVNSLLTSRDPSAFQNQMRHIIGIPAAIPTVAGMLGAAGYRSVAVSASVIVRKTRSSNNLYGGFDRGFEVFDERCEERNAACVNRRAFALLDESAQDSRPVFLYLHYIDPHDPYRPPSDHTVRFVRPYRGLRFIADGNPNPIARQLEQPGGRVSLNPRDVEHLIDLYDEEIAYLDEQFGALLRGLDERGLGDRSLVVLLSDHGEDFLERRSVKHCQGLRDTQIRTPLVLRIPGVGEGRTIRSAAGNIDVVPTLLDYLGIDTSTHDFEGESLRPLIEGASAPERATFSAWGDWRTVVRGDHKLSLHLPSRSTRLYDLLLDPGEINDLSDDFPELSARLQGLLEARIGRVEAGRRRAPDDTVERLRALGYLE